MLWLHWPAPKSINITNKLFCVHILDLLASLWHGFFIFCFTYVDALLADLENTGSPLARCPVLLTSDPPKHSDEASEDPVQTRPPPPAYTPQQVEPEPGTRAWEHPGWHFCFRIAYFYLNIFVTWILCCVHSQTVSAAMKTSQNSNSDKLYR